MTRESHALVSEKRAPVPASFDVLHCALDGVQLVEASAGTGKTWNICGLYVRLLLERGLDVAQILVVTFTNAATAELRERIRGRIVEILAYVGGRSRADPDPFVSSLVTMLEERGMARVDMLKRLDLALQSFDEAAILTIHGFCQRALAETPFATGLPFQIDIQPDDSELRLAVVHDFWRRHIAAEACPPALAAWLDAKRVTPESLAQLLKRHLAKPLAQVRWPDAIDASFEFDAYRLNAHFDEARTTWSTQRDEILRIAQTALPALNAQQYKAKSIAQAAAGWDAWFGHDALSPVNWKKFRPELLSAFCLEKCTKKNQTTPRHAFFEQADALIALRSEAEVQLDRARLRLVRTLFDEAGPELRNRKRDARLAAYDDLLQNLHRALQGSDGEALARSLRQRFPAALIDEFQDTDPVQFAIFRAIHRAGGASLFLVGDPKQAIYAFRNADLHTYLRAAHDHRARWTLGDNQRSTPALIRAINALFDRNARAFMLEGLDYHDVARGRKPRNRLEDRSGASTDLCIWMLPRFSDGAPLVRRDALNAAAAATAAEIARLLRASAAGEITLDGAPLAPHDIAVLVRSHRQGDEIKQALAALGVASVELSQATVFKSAEAEDVERVLAAVLDPGDDGLLRAALATEIFGLDAAQIAALAENESALIVHVQRFLGYRDTWFGKGVGVMYREMLAHERVAARMLARPDGERRLTNLLHLGELLHEAAQTHGAPDALLRWLDTQRRDDARDEVAQLRLESDRNLVQIATIHKVKGLEYPIVFCPYLWDAFQRQRNDVEGREYHDDEGRAVIDFRDDDELGTVGAAQIRDRIKLESSAENLRLAYVALTRASHRCYLIAGCYGKATRNGDAPKDTRCGLLNWLVAGDGVKPEHWLEGAGTTQAIEDAWARLAVDLAPDVAASPLPMAAGTPVPPAWITPETLDTPAPPKRIAEPWRISSFSGLQHGAVSESAALDHDATASDDATLVRATPLQDTPSDDILRFPRGVAAGDCLHAALERIDFTDASGWNDAIAYALLRHPVSLRGVPSAEQQALLHRMMLRMIGDVVRTPLPDGIRLDAIARDRRLTELEFSLPAHEVDANAVNSALKTLGYAVDRLTFGRLDGYLKGFIDLVFEHAGRYYVLDWKSNHLGPSPADYEPGALAVAMAQHGYHLQSLLYSVALTRYLATRLRGYRHDAHFGGVLYLFVRGVRPQWKCADGTSTGAHFHRPSATTLVELERLLGAPEKETRR